MLEGITILDLSTVGPAARASRWLADYGATCYTDINPTFDPGGRLGQIVWRLNW